MTDRTRRTFLKQSAAAIAPLAAIPTVKAVPVSAAGKRILAYSRFKGTAPAFFYDAFDARTGANLKYAMPHMFYANEATGVIRVYRHENGRICLDENRRPIIDEYRHAIRILPKPEYAHSVQVWETHRRHA